MKLSNLFLSSVLIVALLTACGQQPEPEQDMSAAVAAILTQTAAAQPSPTPEVVQGTINGKVGIMAPPTPAMAVYAIDPASGKWATVETPANENGVAEFSLSVPPGTYQLVAYVSGAAGGASAAYSQDGQALSLVSVAANQTVNDVMVQFPGQNECGISLGLPASPDGKYPAVPGPEPACLANLQAAEQANAAAASNPVTPSRVQFAANTSSWSTDGDLQGNSSVAFVLNAMQGQTMSVSANFSPSSGAYFYVRTADGKVLLPQSTSTWSTVLPGSQDYVVGIDNLTAQATHYTLSISIPPLANNAGTGAYSPVSEAVCQVLQELAGQALATYFTMQTNTAFTNPLTQESGRGCTLTASGTGAQFSDPGTVTANLARGMLGWEEQSAYQASGPTGAATAMTRDMGLLLIRVEWAPAAGVTCPGDQPISACGLAPEQEIYTITLQAAQK
ncbi:MAG: hypothetical protein VB089_19965 [Anaerolineaceae bacterium]|nr:hypothetical protein [Anaerolineaceae bacterium]